MTTCMLHGVSRPVALPHCTWSAVWCRPVRSPHIVVVSREWSSGTMLHCSHLSACLACLNGAACPHVS
jgi:hypothetical protein